MVLYVQAVDEQNNNDIQEILAKSHRSTAGAGTCAQRHRHQEWLAFLRQINQSTPKDKDIHVICDNYATHKHP